MLVKVTIIDNKIMKIKETIGIDISKLVFDVRIHSNQKFKIFENSNKGFKGLVEWVYKNSIYKPCEIMFIFEHTGLYSHLLSVYLTENKIQFVLVSGLEIKRSLGMVRGKNDKKDATKIALYGYRLREELKPYQMPSIELVNIKNLLTLRDRLVKQRSGYKASLKEQTRVLVKNDNATLFNTHQKMIHYLTKQINTIEKEIDQIIKSNQLLKNMYTLVTSVKGIGKQTALFLIVYSNGFTKFKNSRKFASYCGIAPFSNTSGTSIRGKTKVSHLANKKIKSLLDLCAKVAIQHNYEMKIYYNKRIESGKNKMSTINIIRNKLLSRVFATVQRNTPYVDILKYVT